MTPDEMRRFVQIMAAKEGVTRFCKRTGINESQLYKQIKGEQPVSPAVAAAFGYQIKKVYVRAITDDEINAALGTI